jgi:hypothetical protein
MVRRVRVAQLSHVAKAIQLAGSLMDTQRKKPGAMLYKCLLPEADVANSFQHALDDLFWRRLKNIYFENGYNSLCC